MIQIDKNMPCSCQECPFLFDTLEGGTTYYYCFAAEAMLSNEEVVTRPDVCPLMEV